MIDMEVLRAMVAEGASAETVVRVVGMMVARDEARRAQWRESQANSRAKRVASTAPQPSQQTVNRLSTDPLSPSSPKEKSPPTPPSKETTPTSPEPQFMGGRDATRPVDEAFAEFWKAYPKRDGANPKQPAAKKFLALLKSGNGSEAIIDGARRYAAECKSKNLIGTPMVAQAMTWLNQQRWTDYAPTRPQTRAPPTAEERKLDELFTNAAKASLNGHGPGSENHQEPSSSAMVCAGDGTRPPQ